MKRLAAGILLLAFAGTTPAQTAKTPKTPATPSGTDWAQFRGANRDGISPDKGLLKSWPEAGPNVALKIEGVGQGFSSVVIVGDKIVTMGDIDKECYVIAANRTTGKQEWKTKVGKGEGGGGYPGPRCTPTIDGDLVYAVSQHGEFVCLNLKDGEEKWRIDYKKDFNGSCGGWQYSESPLIDGDNVICTPGGSEATMLALNKKTGKVVWKGVSPDGDPAGYSSIVISNAAGKKQYVTLTGKALVSFSADQGKLLWRYGNTGNRFADNTANIPTAIPMGEQIFASAGYGRGAALISLKSAGGKIDPKEEYWSDKLKNKHGGVIRVGKNLYGDFDDSGRIWCADAKTGKVLWSRKDRSEGNGSASMTYADGLLYVRYQNGWVSLVDSNPAEYKQISTFKLENGNGNCWAHPVVIGGKLYLREKDVIWVFDVKAKK